MTPLSHVQQFARRNGFTLRQPTYEAQYAVCSTGSRHPAFIGTLRECYVWILGFTWNHGAQAKVPS